MLFRLSLCICIDYVSLQLFVIVLTCVEILEFISKEMLPSHGLRSKTSWMSLESGF